MKKKNVQEEAGWAIADFSVLGRDIAGCFATSRAQARARA